MTSDVILAVNAGSSSIKFAAFAGAADAVLLCRGALTGIGTAPRFQVKSAMNEIIGHMTWPDGGALTHEDLLRHMLAWLDQHVGADALRAVGHRIVHGGGVFTTPVLLTEAVITELETFTRLAPLHQPHNLSPVRAIAALRPHLPQIACFDTAFHNTLPPCATALPLPREYRNEGVRRYGFHGLSYEYIARQLLRVAPDIAEGRVIAAHLGNGASLCALRAGRSFDTTMGFTALDGLMMGTRCGSIDPGVVLYMMQHQGLPAAAIEHLLYQQSGLLGVSGLSSDMHVLLESSDPHARDAIELFAYRIIREAGGLAAVLGGLDGIVFTAGIGENAPEIRARVCAGLAWLGITLNDPAGATGPRRISAAGSAVSVYVIPTDEEAMIVQHVFETLAGQGA